MLITRTKDLRRERVMLLMKQDSILNCCRVPHVLFVCMKEFQHSGDVISCVVMAMRLSIKVSEAALPVIWE
jgi:hypothetical protein